MLELAFREALRMGHNYTGTEHILLALTEFENGTGVLADPGIDKAAAEARITAAVAGRPPPWPAPPGPAVPMTAHLPHHLGDGRHATLIRRPGATTTRITPGCDGRPEYRKAVTQRHATSSASNG